MDLSSVNWKSAELVRRFMSNVQRTKTCWIWTGGLSDKGYGWFYVKNGKVKAHRASYLIHNDITDLGSWHVLHKCDNPACIRPTHIYLGTNADNCLDKARRGRHHNSKLRAEDYRSIYKDTRTLEAIAEDYGVHATLISQIKRGLVGRWAIKARSLKRIP